MFSSWLTQHADAALRRSWQHVKRWPSLCQICHAWPSQVLCDTCVAQFAQPKNRCSTCALPTAGVTCPSCQHAPPLLDACLCAVDYAYPWANCVAQFKFQANPGLARALADLMRHTPWVEPALESAHSLIPIPLSAQRLSERGFNQSHELARHLSPDKADPYTLRRVEHSAHQVGHNKTQRQANVKGSFWLDPKRLDRIQGRRIVLVDDVMTTGASLFEAARTLRAAGAAHITGLVFARTAASW